MMRKILLCTDGSVYSQGSYPYALWFARRLEADVEVLYVTDIRSQKVTKSDNFSGSLGINTSSELLAKIVDLEHDRAKLNHQKAKLILDNAKTYFEKHNLENVIYTHHTGFLVDSFHEFEPSIDLVIMGKKGENAQFASGHLGANIERIARSSHKPILVTTDNHQTINKLLLAYDGGKNCQQALEFVVNSPIFQELELHILTISKKENDENSISYLQKAEIIAKDGGFNPICKLLQGNSENVIGNYVKNNDINLLVMGAYGHSRIRHLVIGSTTAQVLRNTQIPVLLFR